MYGETSIRRCGTCLYHTRDFVTGEWICSNSDSEYFTDYTDYKDWCEEWEKDHEKE